LYFECLAEETKKTKTNKRHTQTGKCKEGGIAQYSSGEFRGDENKKTKQKNKVEKTGRNDNKKETETSTHLHTKRVERNWIRSLSLSLSFSKMLNSA